MYEGISHNRIWVLVIVATDGDEHLVEDNEGRLVHCCCPNFECRDTMMKWAQTCLRDPDIIAARLVEFKRNKSELVNPN